MSGLVALDLFAGTGWGVACGRLGITEYGVEIMDEAVATRAAAGMNTVYRDVWDGLEDPSLTPSHDLLIASPPCQTFSVAGSGSGRKALGDVLTLAGAIADSDLSPSELRGAAAELGDARTALVLTPLLHVRRDRPKFVAWEQVPAVLPVWEACGEILKGWGYSVQTGILNAEQYGVPQTRKRAILAARRDGEPARLPKATHSLYYPRDPKRLDADVPSWVSMADAFGWAAGDLIGFPRLSDGRAEVVIGGTAYRARDLRPASDPAQTVTEKARSWQRFEAVKVMGRGMVERHGERPPRPGDEPAFTIRASAGGMEPGGFVLRDLDSGDTRRLTPAQASTLQSYPTHLVGNQYPQKADRQRHAYAAAEEGCNGQILNARGVAAGISPFSLFIGPAARARAYASEELLEWWASHPRLTFEEYERQRAAEFGGAA